MTKFLLNMPDDLKSFLTMTAKKDGFSLNAQILFILRDWVKTNQNKSQ